ncbi:hydroxymethylbilane synthase [Chloroflexota bacterium]
MKTKIVVGSRGSKLALIQAESVVARLREKNHDIEVSISKIVSGGDRDRRTPLDSMEGIGIFVKELEEALLDGNIDLAVHSLKDMPTEIPGELRLAAVMERTDPGDVLVSRSGSLAELAPAAKIGTCSLRRTVQLNAIRPDLEVRSIRGNIDTRLEKVSRGEYDGVILAAAALIRLGWKDKISEYLPMEHFLPAAGQGALAIETRLNDEEITGFISSLNHLPTWQSITAERTLLRALGGGCRTPIAALGTVIGSTLQLKGMAADSDGKKILYASEEGSVESPEEIGIRLAQKLLAMGAADYITEVNDR